LRSPCKKEADCPLTDISRSHARSFSSGSFRLKENSILLFALLTKPLQGSPHWLSSPLVLFLSLQSSGIIGSYPTSLPSFPLPNPFRMLLTPPEPPLKVKKSLTLYPCNTETLLPCMHFPSPGVLSSHGQRAMTSLLCTTPPCFTFTLTPQNSLLSTTTRGLRTFETPLLSLLPRSLTLHSPCPS